MNLRMVASFLPFLLAVESAGGPLFAPGPSRRGGGKAGKRRASVVVSSAEIRAYLPFVHWHAQRLRRRLPPWLLYEDIVAAGTMGLFKALANDANATKDYLSTRIRGEMTDELRRQDWSPRRVSKRASTDAIHVETTDDMTVHAKSVSMDEHVESMDLRRALAILPARERMVIESIYLDGTRGDDIGLRLGVTPARVCQIRDRAVERMRRFHERGCAA